MTAATARAAEPGLPLSSLTFARVRLADMDRVRTAFAEGHKHAPGCDRMPWRYYKRFTVPELNAALVHPDTQIVGAYADSLFSDEPALHGWIAFARGKRVDTVHWVSVPYWIPVPHTACTGCADPKHHAGRCPLAPDNRTELRRRGIMTALLDAAGLQERLAYTFRGAKHEHRADGHTMDERLLPWLRERGHHVVHMPWGEWSR